MVAKTRLARGTKEDAYLEMRLRQEMQAALRCDDAKAAAAHVDLATRYLVQLNRDKANRSAPMRR